MILTILNVTHPHNLLLSKNFFNFNGWCLYSVMRTLARFPLFFLSREQKEQLDIVLPKR
ncbi:MAG: hypothetical protein PVS3B3_32910 [Ktedonobacteraceae bacterium]